MTRLNDILDDSQNFACGVELVTTRGMMDEVKAVRTRTFAKELAADPRIDWVSITDNAGGNPQLSPISLGTPILYADKEVVIHLSCKDSNRNGLESTAWQLASEGFHNILTLTGDYPLTGYSGAAKPVFDIDSVGLLTLLSEMNQGLGVSLRNGQSRSLNQTRFYLGAVATNFKIHEREVIPQYLKLRKKIQCGARFIIGQIGFDAQKYSEMIGYMRKHGMGNIPLIGNVFVMNAAIARFFHNGRIPGVIVSDDFLDYCERAGNSPDKGRRFFLELAAKQTAIFKGLGYRGVYYGGIDRAGDVDEIMRLTRSFATDDWKAFAKEIQFSRPGEFFYFAQDPDTLLSDTSRLNRDYERSLKVRPRSHNVTLGYRIGKAVHDRVFTPGRRVYRLGRRLYERSAKPEQGPYPLRVLERASKAVMFGCKDCGDCSLPDIGYLCPESSCVKNQRNGPCGGTRLGHCEVKEFECIWARAYDRAKADGREQQLLDFAPVIQDQSLRGTSSWGNTFRGIDHHTSNPHRNGTLTQPPIQVPHHEPDNRETGGQDPTPLQAHR
jgi:methylenetetrahydrofolate reductase (NADH)